jgi:TusA-related sulfurtransferase
MTRFSFLLALLAAPGFTLAQDATGQHIAGMSHEGAMHTALPDGVTEGGQSAFAAVQEIVQRLMADPGTDWARVDVEVLRQHLIDMDNVTLRARVAARDIEGGARFEVTSDDPEVMTSIRTMVPDHAATVDGDEGWTFGAEEMPGGEVLTVTGDDPARIRALGFIGIMTVGMHHQSHHLALATGGQPHAR